jgi:hypothetical protein
LIYQTANGSGAGAYRKIKSQNKMNTSLYQVIKSLEYNYRYGRTQWQGYNNIWHIDWWDGRTSAVKQLKAAGISREDAAAILRKRIARLQKKTSGTEVLSQSQRVSFLKIVNECIFDIEAKSSRYNCSGIDWKAFHRPSSSGGWVLIAPDEPGNNWHTTDPIIVKYLTKKFLK